MTSDKPSFGLKLYAWFVGSLFALRALVSKERATHAKGRSASGLLQLTGDTTTLLGLPNKGINVHMRFSNLSAMDDLGLDVRGLALTCKNLRLDLVMNTGPTLLFWNAPTLVLFTLSNAIGKSFLKRYYKRYPKALTNLKAAAVRAPESYADLSYYSQIPVLIATIEGEKLARFRMIPDQKISYDKKDEKEWWDTSRDQHTQGPENSTRLKLASDCEDQRTMFWQVSFAAYTQSNCDPSVAWPEKSSPWITLGQLSLQSTLEEMKPVDSNRLPQWWSTLRGNTFKDVNLMSELRAGIYRRSRNARS